MESGASRTWPPFLDFTLGVVSMRNTYLSIPAEEMLHWNEDFYLTLMHLLWCYMQIVRDEGEGCLMCKCWFWATVNVLSTAFLLIAFLVESRNVIRKGMNVSLKRTSSTFHSLNRWRTEHIQQHIADIKAQAVIVECAPHFYWTQSFYVLYRGIGVWIDTEW